MDLPRDSSSGNYNDNDLTIKPYNVQNKNNLSARKSARNKDNTINSSSIEESKMNNKFQLNAKMLLSSPMSEWINIGNNLSRHSSYEQCKRFFKA